MQVYLLKDVPGKGKAGEIINVNDGYGKNYLIKNKLGQVVTPEIASKVKAKSDSDAFKLKTQREEIGTIIERLRSAQVSVSAKVGDEGKLFGAVTTGEVAKALNDLGFAIEKRQLTIVDGNVKALGAYKIVVTFPLGMRGEFTLEVKCNKS
jgi:large subunit ribosomal protein L9